MHKQFYGFSEEPFASDPDPGFWYLSRPHFEAYSSMMSGIEERRGIMLLTGEEGTGKSTLLQQVLRSVDPSVKAVLVSNPSNDFDEILREILLGLGLPLRGEGKSSMLSQFHDYLSRGLAKGESVLIAVDDAHTLRGEILEEIRMLSNPDPTLPGPGLVQEILSGRVELEEMLQSKDLRQILQRIAVRCRLEPLSQLEARQYMEHRLKRVGRDLEDLFSPDAVDLICKSSQGVPGKLNMLCYMAVCSGYALSRNEIDSDLVEKVSPVLGWHSPGRWKGAVGLVNALAGHIDESPFITKVTYMLLLYSFLALFTFFWLNLLF